MTETIEKPQPTAAEIRDAAIKRNKTTARPQPKISRPQLSKEIVLRSPESQHAYTQNFRFVARGFFDMSVRCRSFRPLRSDNAQKNLDKLVDFFLGQYGELSDDFNRSTSAIKQQLKELGLKNDDIVQYSTPLVINEQITTPHIFKHVELMNKLDTLCAITDTWWMHGGISDKDARTGKMDFRNAVIRLGNRVNHTASALRKACEASRDQDLTAEQLEELIR